MCAVHLEELCNVQCYYQNISYSSPESKYPSYSPKVTDSNNMYDKFSEEDYEELIEKLKVADLQYQEYSLEDIIYQLAKVMFAQSLAHGE